MTMPVVPAVLSVTVPEAGVVGGFNPLGASGNQRCIITGTAIGLPLMLRTVIVTSEMLVPSVATVAVAYAGRSNFRCSTSGIVPTPLNWIHRLWAKRLACA